MSNKLSIRNRLYVLTQRALHLVGIHRRVRVGYGDNERRCDWCGRYWSWPARYGPAIDDEYDVDPLASVREKPGVTP